MRPLILVAVDTLGVGAATAFDAVVDADADAVVEVVDGVREQRLLPRGA